MAADITAISVSIRNDISDYLLSAEGDCCDHKDFKEFAFYSDIDTVLNLDTVTSIFTNEEILALAAFANADNPDAPVFAGNGSVTGTYPLIDYSQQSFSGICTGTVQPLNSGVNSCIRCKISDFLLASECCTCCSDDDLKKFLFYNDIDTVLGYDIISEFLTQGEITKLIGFTGCLGCGPALSAGTGAIAGGAMCGCCSCSSSSGSGGTLGNYPIIGYVNSLNTYQYDATTLTFPNEYWIYIDYNQEWVGIANDLDELIVLLDAMDLGDWSVSGSTISGAGYHVYGEMLPATANPVEVVEVDGCMDPTATNYNPLATNSDGSCTYNTDVFGCTDPLALNYNPLATVNQGCTYAVDPTPDYVTVICSTFTVVSDINYVPADATLVYDSYVETCNVNTNRPVFICLHGGGGTKTNLGMISWCERFASRGYKAYSIEYGETGNGVGLTVARQKKGIINLSAFIRYLRQNAVAQGINPLNIFTFGVSAGGIISDQQSMCANDLDADDPFFLSATNLLYAAQSSVPSAASSAPGSSSGQFLDRLTAADRKIFLYHGTVDPKIPYASALSLYNTMISLGIGSTLVPYIGDGHGLGSHDDTIAEGGDLQVDNVTIDSGLIVKFAALLLP